jgi:hypothetical protein
MIKLSERIILAKLLLRDNQPVQSLIAFWGIIIGFLLLLGSVQLYFDFTSYLEKNQDIIKPEYIIINKKVGAMNLAKLSGTTFSPEEINDISHQTFASEVAPFMANDFHVSASLRMGGAGQTFYTDLFFEALPDKYLDIEPEKWHWKSGDSIIPIAIPKDYLNLYNFGFAQSQGLPQISGGMASIVTFSIVINGNGHSGTFRGRIAGFTERINSILVPYNFLEWANKEYSNGLSAPSRLLMVAKNPSDTQISKYLDGHNWETSQEKLRSSKLNTLLKAVLSIVSIIGFVIVLLSFTIFILAFQLMITKSREKLKLLLHLGYNYKKLSLLYILYFLSLILLVNIISYIILLIFKTQLIVYLSNIGIEISSTIAMQTNLIALGLNLLIIIINSILIYFQIKNCAKI